MPLDPFKFKHYGKGNPVRLGFTAFARLIEWSARRAFDRFELSWVDFGWPSVVDFALSDTAVTPRQMGALLYFLRETETFMRTAVVEIGSYRGVTTAKFSETTERMVYAIDPFKGYGGAKEDYNMFLFNTQKHSSIEHIRMTSGAAAREWNENNISFLFIDAVHDYVNTIHDAESWLPMIVPGGMLALHDTDNRSFAGTRMAAWRLSKRMKLVCHIPDLVIFQKG